MKKMLPADTDGSRFVGLYGISEDQGDLIQKLTPPRDSIDAVMADLADKQRHEGKLEFVQIVDLSMLQPVEPYQTTLARLHSTALA